MQEKAYERRIVDKGRGDFTAQAEECARGKEDIDKAGGGKDMMDFVRLAERKQPRADAGHYIKRKPKTIKEMALDAAIIGGIAFFAAWSGGIEDLLIPVKAFGGAFVLQFALERGLKK